MEDATSDLMDKLKPFKTAAETVGKLVSGTYKSEPKQKGPVDSGALLDRNEEYMKQRRAAQQKANVPVTTPKVKSPKMSSAKGGKR